MKQTMHSVYTNKNTRCVHIETELAIINVFVNLQDIEGRRVERVEIIPNNYAGEAKVTTDDNIRSVRIVEELPA